MFHSLARLSNRPVFLLYKLGLGLVTLTMLLLPMVYVALFVENALSMSLTIPNYPASVPSSRGRID
ncbi:MAG: hypothetical protein RL088_564 [Verrucomicrobiota bacterium]|jgi:hypothetical protein